MRHFFHLQFIAVLGVLFSVYLVLLLLRSSLRWLRTGGRTPALRGHAKGSPRGASRRKKLPPPPEPRRDLRSVARELFPSGTAFRLILMVSIVVLLTIVPLWVLRVYQTRHLVRLFQAYIGGPKEPIEPLLTPLGGGTTLARWDGMQGRTYHDGFVLSAYYMIEFDSATDAPVDLVKIRYKSDTDYNAYTKIVTLCERTGTNRLFFPVYGVRAGPRFWEFEGLEMTASLARRLRRLYRLETMLETPHLLDLALSNGWEDETLCQTLLLEQRENSQKLNIRAALADPASMRLEWIDALASPALDPSPKNLESTYSASARMNGAQIEMDGEASARSAYLFQFKPVSLSKGSLLVSKGRLERGGLAVGLLKDNRWHSQAVIAEPGQFLAAVEAKEDGVFVPVITNATVRDHEWNRFRITRFGVVRPEPLMQDKENQESIPPPRP